MCELVGREAGLAMEDRVAVQAEVARRRRHKGLIVLDNAEAAG
jgi:hypothetical protein